jgi:hypothetical protein
MPRALKACGNCGNPTTTTPCTPCTPPKAPGRHTQSRTKRGYDNYWIRLRDQAIRKQPWCAWPEGCTYPVTRSNPLTGEHVVPVSVDPSRRLDKTNVIVLCLKHNSRRRRLDTT